MKVRVGFVGFSGLEPLVGAEHADVEIAGSTLADLLAALESTFGAALLERLCHEGRVIDAGVLVLRNDVRIDAAKLSQAFADGDQVSFVRMVAGG